VRLQVAACRYVCLDLAVKVGFLLTVFKQFLSGFEELLLLYADLLLQLRSLLFVLAVSLLRYRSLLLELKCNELLKSKLLFL
jgi:hypothetical protein